MVNYLSISFHNPHVYQCIFKQINIYNILVLKGNTFFKNVVWNQVAQKKSAPPFVFKESTEKIPYQHLDAKWKQEYGKIGSGTGKSSWGILGESKLVIQ